MSILKKGKKLLKSAQSHEAQSLFEITPQSTPEDKKNNWSNPNRNKNEWRYTPKLPTPVKKSSTVRIIFTREKEDVKILSKYFFGHEDASASDVGMQCFDTVIEEVK